MREDSRFWLILGYTLALSMAFVLMYTFFVAYFNGYRVVVNVNRYGEAMLEFFLVFFSLPFILYGYILAWLGGDRERIGSRKKRKS